MKRKLIPQTLVCLSVSLLCAPALQADWSFVMLGDTRDVDYTTTGVSPYLNTIAQKIATLNPDLVLMGGDLANGNALTNGPSHSLFDDFNGNFTDANAYTLYTQMLNNWKTAMQPVYNYSTGTGTPIYTVRGNHENNDTEGAPIAVLKQAYYDAFSSYVPGNGPNNGVTDNEQGFSWSFTHKGVTFVAADQYFKFDPTYASSTPWSGYHYLDQSWVTQQFQQSSSPYKIFMSHEPFFQTQGNGPGQTNNQEAEHFFGTNTAALLTRSDFWNALGTNGVQLYMSGHIHLETVASITNASGNAMIQIMAGNGGAPPQNFIDNPEAGVNTLYNSGSTLVYTNGEWMVDATVGFSLATVGDTNMTIQYYSYNTNDSTWAVASYVTSLSPNLVPEPSTAVLLAPAMAALMIGWFRKRRKN